MMDSGMLPVRRWLIARLGGLYNDVIGRRAQLGVEAVTAELRAVYYKPKFDQHHFAFLCRLPDGSDPKVNSVEILECAYWPIDALPHPINDFTIRRIRDAHSNQPIAVRVHF